MTDQIWKLSATELAAAYRRSELRPSEVLEAVLVRTEEVNPTLNLFAKLDAEGARQAARESDERFANDTPNSALDGVPLTIKDNIPVKGLPCAWGSKLYLDWVPQADELPVERLRQNGAVILGKTNVSEFTLGRGNINTLAFGVTRNPWDPALTPGASTGGGAAAAASGVGAIAIGTDGGGSIRRPAGYNNLVGLKPSTGRVARINGLPPILHDFEIIGPIARTVDDVATTLSLIEGPHPQDRASFGFAKGALEPAPKALRVLYVPRFDAPVDDEITVSCAKAAGQLTELGYEVTEGKAPFDVSVFEKHWPVVGAAGLAWLLRDKQWQGQVGTPYPPMIESGNALKAIDYVDALLDFSELYRQFATAFETYDIIMTPTSGAMPWAADEFAPPHHRAFTGIVNVTGLPAVSLPGPMSPKGMPIGFQLIAPFGADWRLLSIAKAFEASFPWTQNWPDLGA